MEVAFAILVSCAVTIPLMCAPILIKDWRAHRRQMRELRNELEREAASRRTLTRVAESVLYPRELRDTAAKELIRLNASTKALADAAKQRVKPN